MKVIYRISDKSYIKPKLPGITKEFCLDNCLSALGKIDIVIADNCNESTIEMLKRKNLEIMETSLGNAGSFGLALNFAVSTLIADNNETIYFVEDDYIHKKCKNLLDEGLTFSDYVTLYDHPDKYTNMYNHGEVCKVRFYKNQHWRSSVSTTMTFAAKLKTLKEDCSIFFDICKNKFHPDDHTIFQELHNKKKRNLYVSIPGHCIHADIRTNILYDEDNELDYWVVDLLEKHLKKQIREEHLFFLEQIPNYENLSGLKKLLLLNQIITNISE